MCINLMFINTLSSSQPQSYFVQPQTSTSALDVDTLSCFGSSSSEEEEVSDTSSTSSSSVEEYPRVSFMIRLFSVKIINVTFSLSRTIDDVRTEIQAQFGLVPSQYILKAGCKPLSNSNCSLLDYNITSNQTLDIVLRANQCLSGGTGAKDNNSHDNIDERLRKKVSELDSDHGLQLQRASDEELGCVLRDKSGADRKLVMRAFKVQLNERRDDQSYRKLKQEELISSFLRQKDAGFPLLRWSLMTRAEQEADRRANEMEEETRLRLDKVAKHSAYTRAKRSETKKQADNAQNAQHMAQVRAEERAQIEHSWPTLDTPGWQVPGEHYSVENHTDNPVAAVYLSHARTGCWLWWELNCLLAYIHVSNRLILKISDEDSALEAPRASAKLSKLNGLLEMSVDRGETLLKIMETIFDGDDRRRADEYYRERGGFRGIKPDEEVLLDWFVDNDSISLDERKSKLPLPEDAALDKRKTWMESLVGLRLNVPQFWWIDKKTGKSIGGEILWSGKIDSVCTDNDKGKCSFIFKCDDKKYKKGYRIEYCDVKKYAVEEDRTQFSLPKDPPCSYIDSELEAACNRTLEELRKSSKMPLSMLVFCLPCSNFSFVC